jgi:hypothetical protein
MAKRARDKKHQWSYTIGDGQIMGPASEADFIEAIKSGQVQRTTRVRSDTRTNGKWVQANQVPSVKNAFDKLNVPHVPIATQPQRPAVAHTTLPSNKKRSPAPDVQMNQRLWLIPLKICSICSFCFSGFLTALLIVPILQFIPIIVAIPLAWMWPELSFDRGPRRQGWTLVAHEYVYFVFFIYFFAITFVPSIGLVLLLQARKRPTKRKFLWEV